MKKAVIFTAVVVLAGVVCALRFHSPQPKFAIQEPVLETKQRPATAPISQVSVPIKSATGAVEDNLAAPPVDGHLCVWEFDGRLNAEMIARYRLTPDQVAQLKGLKEELAKRMLSIDLAHASIKISPDRRSLSVTIKADATAAKEFTDFYQARLEEIIGSQNYNDLAKYIVMPTTDDVVNAGLQDKDIEIQKVGMTDNQAEYHIKSESRLKVSPPGMAPAYDSKTVEATGNRDKIASAYPGVSLILPSDI